MSNASFNPVKTTENQHRTLLHPSGLVITPQDLRRLRYSVKISTRLLFQHPRKAPLLFLHLLPLITYINQCLCGHSAAVAVPPLGSWSIVRPPPLGRDLLVRELRDACSLGGMLQVIA